MNAKELAALVNEMRNAQKEFFRTRSSSAMDRAKSLEKKVDLACKELLDQPQLF